jgi:NAD(P)-dependent dehydrogenase (short-subunit alcohol dehydrogenase family)
VSELSISLKNRRILITGASMGLGSGFAKLYASLGASVALAARSVDKLKVLEDEIKAAGGVACSVAMDVQDEASIIRGFDAAEAAIGPLNGVVANAGMSSEGMAVDLPADELNKVLSVNIGGVYLTAREAARRMIPQGRDVDGRILLIASIGGFQPLPGVAAYSASKAAVIMMGKCLAREWMNRGINVNCLCPGFILTNINAEWFASEGGKKQMQRWPRKRLMKEEDLYFQAAYLMSDISGSVTGTSIVIDDGQML